MTAPPGARLRSVTALIPAAARCVADIGAGHGALAASLAVGGGRRVIATELAGGSLAELRANIARWGLDGRVDVRCGRGLEPLDVGEADAVVIAGVGANTALSVANASRSAGVRWLVLQCMQRDELVRPWLRERGWRVLEQVECVQRHRAYRARLVEVGA